MTLPNFLVIGAAKSGTTSLHHYLAQHPEIYVSPGTLGCFFAYEGAKPTHKGPADWEMDRWAVTDLEGYEASFAGARGEKAVGEVCAAYLYHAAAAQRIRTHLPAVKLVAVLRDPVDRAYSNYLHKVRDGVEPLASFAAAIEAEPERIREGWRYTWHYLSRSLYFAQLRPYYRLFPENQIRVLLFEDLCARPERLFGDLFGFLGVDEDFRPDMSLRLQATGVPRSRALADFIQRPSFVKTAYRRVLPSRYRRRVTKGLEGLNLRKPALADPLRQELRAAYREDVERLQDLIGRDLSHWFR